MVLCLTSVYAQENFFGSSASSLQYAANPQLRYQQELATRAYNFIPQDPWRLIDGETNYAKGENWMIFSGEIIDDATYWRLD